MGAKKHPQMRQDHPQVVSGAAQQCVQRITLGTLEPVARQQPVALTCPLTPYQCFGRSPG